MSDYYYVANDGENMYTERRSKFLTVLAKAETEEKAREILDSLKSQYHDATHVCYAYRIGDKGECVRFSDGGEPSGTAGAPILAALTENECTYTLAAVIRWFGGVKLGAGGLVRAYSGCVAENVETAQKALYETCAELEISCGYSSVDAAERYFNENSVDILNTEYADEVVFKVAVRKKGKESFDKELINRLNGNVKIIFKREYFFPFKV